MPIKWQRADEEVIRDIMQFCKAGLQQLEKKIPSPCVILKGLVNFGAKKHVFSKFSESAQNVDKWYSLLSLDDVRQGKV